MPVGGGSRAGQVRGEGRGAARAGKHPRLTAREQADRVSGPVARDNSAARVLGLEQQSRQGPGPAPQSGPTVHSLLTERPAGGTSPARRPAGSQKGWNPAGRGASPRAAWTPSGQGGGEDLPPPSELRSPPACRFSQASNRAGGILCARRWCRLSRSSRTGPLFESIPSLSSCESTASAGVFRSYVVVSSLLLRRPPFGRCLVLFFAWLVLKDTSGFRYSGRKGKERRDWAAAEAALPSQSRG